MEDKEHHPAQTFPSADQGVSEESEKIFVGTLSQDKKRWIIKVIVQVGKESISTYALIRFDRALDQTSIVSMKPWSLSNDQRRLGGRRRRRNDECKLKG